MLDESFLDGSLFEDLVCNVWSDGSFFSCMIRWVACLILYAIMYNLYNKMGLDVVRGGTNCMLMHQHTMFRYFTHTHTLVWKTAHPIGISYAIFRYTCPMGPYDHFVT